MLTYGDFDGMAFGSDESFTQPGVDCDLTKIQALPGGAEDRWRAYCDCAFLETRSRSQLVINGKLFGDRTEMPDAVWDEYLRPIIATLKPGTFSLTVNVFTTRGDANNNWHKCMSGLCANPFGCDNGQKAAAGATGSEAKDPFNVSPFMAYPPWDDVGAAARGIPKRNANAWYTFGQLFSYDAAAYDPIALWKIAWTNPGLYSLLGLKAGLIPFNPMLAYFVTGPVGLFPFVCGAIAQKYGNQADYSEYLFKPVGAGWIQFGKLAIKYITKCGFGIPGACGAGVVLKQVAEDQITSGEINNVLDPSSRAVIVFLAKYGDQLADRLFGLAEMAQHLRADPSLIAWFQQVFHVLRGLPELDPAAQLFLGLGERLLGMAYAIAQGIQQGRDAGTIVDEGVNALLGFRPSLILALIQQGNIAGARTVVQQAAAQTGLTIAQMGPLTASLIPALQTIVKTLGDMNSKINGGLEDVISLFNSVKAALEAAATSSTNAVNQVAASLSSPVSPAVVAAPASVSAGKFANTSGIAATPAQLQVASSGGGGAGVLVLAALGFAVGGPAGAAVGAAIGAFSGRK